MRAFYTKHFLDHYAAAPPRIQKAVDRRVALLLQDLRHPSLRAKKYDEAQGIWQARVNGGGACISPSKATSTASSPSSRIRNNRLHPVLFRDAVWS